jgi:hypothetical protein
MLWRLDYLIQLDDIRMTHQLKNVDFTGYPFHVRHIDYPRFFQYFYSYGFVRWEMRSSLDLPKCAFSKCAAELSINSPKLIVADYWSFFYAICLCFQHITE